MRVVLGRLASLIVVATAVSLLTFLLMQMLPGDPVTAILGENTTEEAVAALRADLGLDKPLPAQYLSWMSDAVRGDLGESFRTGQPVTEAIVERLPVTIELIVLGLLFALVAAVPAGIWSGYRQGGAVDRCTEVVAFALVAVPTFVVAIVFLLVFSVRLGWFPVQGYIPISEDLWGNLHHVALPSIALACGVFPTFQRMVRNAMVETLQHEYITTARAKGLPTHTILIRHALRPSLLPLVTVVGIAAAGLISGTVIVEQVFGLPGIGRLLLDSIFSREYITTQGIVLVSAIAYVLINFLVDISYFIINPRLRHAARV